VIASSSDMADLVVLFQNFDPPLSQRSSQFRRTLDVGEQEGHGSRCRETLFAGIR
jgi:hypothetical protein